MTGVHHTRVAAWKARIAELEAEIARLTAEAEKRDDYWRILVENREAEVALLTAALEEDKQFLEERIQERLDEINAEGEAFDKDCHNALRFVLEHYCGDAGRETLNDLDGWTAQSAIDCIGEGFLDANAQITRLTAALAEASNELADAERSINDLKGALGRSVDREAAAREEEREADAAHLETLALKQGEHAIVYRQCAAAIRARSTP